VRLTRAEAEDFLYHEAALLDERRLEEWLDLFTADGVYWIPMEDDADPELEPSIMYDDSSTRAQRVYQLLHQPHYAQMPPSRTVHFISNVQVAPGAEDGEAIVRCSLAVSELRPGDPRQHGLGVQRALTGRCEYHLRYEDGWRIARKKILLLNRDLPQENLTFIL
jgi:3-phenylpropionate/cinnamic acid dioxygenase small subunit